MPESGIFRRKGDPPKLHSAVLLDANFQQLVGKIAVLHQLVKNQREKLPLEIEIQTEGSVDAHEPCMQTHVRVFSSGSRFACWPAKVDAVVRNKSPVAFEDDSLEFPVFYARFAQVIHMRANKAPQLGVGGQRRAQVFINEYFLQTPSLLERSHEVASWKRKL